MSMQMRLMKMSQMTPQSFPSRYSMRGTGLQRMGERVRSSTEQGMSRAGTEPGGAGDGEENGEERHRGKGHVLEHLEFLLGFEIGEGKTGTDDDHGKNGHEGEDLHAHELRERAAGNGQHAPRGKPAVAG